MTQEKQKRPYTRTIKVYVVSHPDRMDRLVRAISAAEAIRHASSGYEAKVATQNDIIELMASGTPVETTVAASVRGPEVVDDGLPAGLSD